MYFFIWLCLTFMIDCSDAFAQNQNLYISQRVTEKYKGSNHIEGPAVDTAGNLYFVNFLKRGTIAKLDRDRRRPTIFATLLNRSIGNGIRFDRGGNMYVADYKKHNIIVFRPPNNNGSIYFHSSNFHQPNDLAIASNGSLYASDPDFGSGTGQILKINRTLQMGGDGIVLHSERRMGTTNGLDLNPDETKIYVSESNTGEIWEYKLSGADLIEPRIVKKFSGELDGLRVDEDGRIYVVRVSTGTVAVLKPDGTLVREIKLIGKTPTNLTFGGREGKTVYVTQTDGGYIEAFQVDRAGREQKFLH